VQKYDEFRWEDERHHRKAGIGAAATEDGASAFAGDGSEPVFLFCSCSQAFHRF
jgi:hypothetical protein